MFDTARVYKDEYRLTSEPFAFAERQSLRFLHEHGHFTYLRQQMSCIKGVLNDTVC